MDIDALVPIESNEPSSASGSKPSKEQQKPSESSSGQDDQAQAEGKDSQSSSLDLTQHFAKEATEHKSVVPLPTTRDRFLESQLVVPGIALKKFLQVSQSTEGLGETREAVDVKNYVGVMGTDSYRMYKQSRPRVCALMMGDISSDPHFWQHAQDQLKGHPVGAICFFNTFEGQWSEALGSKTEVLLT